MKKTRNRIVFSLVISSVAHYLYNNFILCFKIQEHSIFWRDYYLSIPNGDGKIGTTFDDGPTENTSAILDKLDEMEVKATFFVCGAEINARPQDAKAIVEAGHELGNHSYSHKRMILKPYAFVKRKLNGQMDMGERLCRRNIFQAAHGKKLLFSHTIEIRLG